MGRVLIILMFSSVIAHAEPIVGKARIVDADTMQIGSVVIRLEGIDAPEIKQSCRNSEGKAFDCGLVASRMLAEFIKTADLRCESSGLDQTGRTLAYCFLSDGTELNAKLVATGYAFAFTQYSDRYVAHEKLAQTARLGLWSGTFSYPWCHRDVAKGKPCRGPDAFDGTELLSGPAINTKRGELRDKKGYVVSNKPLSLSKISADHFDCAPKYCKQMLSCQEARYHHTVCGDSRLDRDNDGVPCENVCGSR